MFRLLLKRAALILICATASLSGCVNPNPRVVLIPPGEPVQLAEPVTARVYIKGADGVRVESKNRVTIPEGYFALPDPGTKK